MKISVLTRDLLISREKTRKIHILEKQRACELNASERKEIKFMSRVILITGGAGFIGSHLAERLIEKGYRVRLYDNLNPQVHGPNAELPAYLRRSNIEFLKGEMSDSTTLRKAIKGINVIVHLAAETGVGQSMYEVEKYAKTNIQGIAILLDILANGKHQVEKIVLASSRAVYGEGKYECERCGIVYPPPREAGQIKNKDWGLKCPCCKKDIKALPTDEDSPLNPGSIYAITKQTQEQLISNFCKSFKIPFVILRYQNVYGPRQSLSNPYTGILSIFSTRIMNGEPPLIFEDGKESRDFIYIDDVIQATTLAIENKTLKEGIFNVGTGRKVSVLEVANILLGKFNLTLKPKIIEKGRIGDIRSCYADLTRVKGTLGYKPKYDIEVGLTNFIDWVKSQPNFADLSEKANEELKNRGLFT